MLPAATPDTYLARSSNSPPLRQARTVYRMEDGDRRFSEQEVDAILSHAIELEKAGLPQQGLTLAASVAAPLGVFGAPLIALAVGGGALGAAVGRGIWELAARDTARRTDRLATELASAAEELGSTGSASGYDSTS